MKKKLLVSILSLSLILGLTACGEEEAEPVTSVAEEVEAEPAAESTDIASDELLITINNLGNDEYSVSMDPVVTQCELYTVHLNDNLEYVLDELLNTYDPATENPFTICDSADSSADLMILAYYPAGVKAYALEPDGVNGGLNAVDSYFAAEGAATSENGATVSNVCADDFLGIWGDNRATLDVSLARSGNYVFTITWPESAFAYHEWSYYCSFDSENGFMNDEGTATHYIYTYENEEDEPILTDVYDNGSGSFYFENNAIRWVDNVDNAGEDLHFVQ